MNLTEKKIYYTPPSERICVDGDDMWFVSAYGNVLCRGSMATGVCKCVVKIPREEKEDAWLCPCCIKYRDTIIMGPDKAKNIWYYDLKKARLDQIIVANPQNVQLSIYDQWIIGDKLWAWSGRYDGLYCLIEVDLEDYQAKGYYRIAEDDDFSFAWQPAKWENCIYFFENNKKELYEFDTVAKKTTKYKLDGIEGVIVTVCCDRDTIWLAGEEKCIYTWQKATRELARHTNFPEDFQIVRTEKPLSENVKWNFYYSVCLHEYVCFIPRNIPGMKCSGVVFMNKRDHTMKMLRLYDATGNGERQYKLEYVLADRYVGIYYWPNCYISEIDTADFTVKKKWLRFSSDCCAKF